MSNPIIKVKHLQKEYELGEREPYLTFRDTIVNAVNPVTWFKRKEPQNTFLALDDVNFEMYKGDVLGLIGRNGAGKSTLLKVLSRITPPTKGTIDLHGRVASLLEVGTGFHPELTGRENVYLNGAILGMQKKEIQKKFDEIVEFAEVEKFLDTPVKKYSSGMYVRLAFAVAAHLEPEILLVDEVLAVGDISFQKKCLGKMNEVTQQEGRTIIFVSHNVAAIQKLCKQALWLESGKTKMMGDVDEVIQRYIESSETLVNTPLSERTDHTGNGKIKLMDFYLENSKGQKVPYISSGEDINLCFVLEKQVVEKIPDVELSFALRNQSEVNLVLHKTSYKKSNFILDKDTVTVKCHVPHFPFASGLYTLSTRISMNQYVIDELDTATQLEVIMGDYFKNQESYQPHHSPFLMDGDWEIV